MIDPAAAGSKQTLPGRIVAHLRRDLPLALLDVAIVVAVYTLPLVLVYDGIVPSHAWHMFWRFLPIVALVHLLSNYLFALYGQMWRYASIQEARRVVLAGATALVIVLILTFAAQGEAGRPVPISVAGLGGGTAVLAFGAVRFQSRLFAFRRRAVESAPRMRTLLYGVGEAGAQIFNDVLRHPEAGIEIVGLLDDDRRRHGLSLHGVSVLGEGDDIPDLAERLHADQVLLAIPSANSQLIREVAARCQVADVSLRVLPSVREIVGGRVSVRDLRDLSIEDLLGRQQVETDLDAVAALLRERRVLVTGAGGSIGAEIVRQVAAFEPAQLLVLDNDETHLHDVLCTLPTQVTCVLADVRDRARMVEVLAEHRPDVVFHAAAHKHVPILETHPHEAYLTNVMGTANVAEAAVVAGVGTFVLVSTDKAVRPSSVMGASKRIAEDVIRSLDGRSTVFCAVRFGNVLGSRGSVIPTFLRQIQAGGPVTVTDERMTRYFMSVEEAVQLVLQAGSMAKGGEVFTLEMGEPVRIIDLAHKLIRLSGRVPGRDVRVEIIGARPGEKHHEELIEDDEQHEPSGHPGVVVARPPRPSSSQLRATLRLLEHLSLTGTRDELAEAIRGAARLEVRAAGGAA